MGLQSVVAKRVFFGAVMILALGTLLAMDGWLSARDCCISSGKLRGIIFVLLLAIVLAKGAEELSRMMRAKGTEPAVWLIIPTIVLLLTQPFWCNKISPAVCWAGILFGSLLTAALVQGIKYRTKNTLTNLSGFCLSIIYLGVGGWFLAAIRLIGTSEPGTWGQIAPLVMFLACVKSCDIGAYFTGRFLGRHKMIPSISPGKTWEGLIGGVVLAVIAASLFACFAGTMGYGKSAVFGVAVAVSGQLGDLLESMLKRDAGSKDSASLVPEFGGVLDLLDSPLAAAPIAYIVLTIEFPR